MNPLFAFHRLNAAGIEKAQNIACAFSELAKLVVEQNVNGSRERSIALSKLEEACFFAKKSMACLAENQETP